MEFESELNFVKTSLFGQISKKALDNKLIASFGIRTDQNSYSKEMSNPLKQLSPRLSIAYEIAEKSSLNFNIGQYFQLTSIYCNGLQK